MSRVPRRSLPPQSEEWGRWVERAIKDLTQASGSTQRLLGGMVSTAPAVDETAQRISLLEAQVQDATPTYHQDEAPVGTFPPNAQWYDTNDSDRLYLWTPDEPGNPISTGQWVPAEQSVVLPVAPATPTGVSAASQALTRASGEPYALVTVSAPDVTLDVEGNPVSVASYEVWGHLTGDTTVRLLGSATVPAVKFEAEQGKAYNLALRAISEDGVASGISAQVAHTTSTDSVAPPVPTGGTAQHWLRTITVKWAGTPTMPADFSHVNVYEGAVLVGRIGPLGVWQSQGMQSLGVHTFYLRAVDRSGNSSANSAAITVTVSANADMSQVTDSIDAAVVDINNAGSLLVEAGKTLTTKLGEVDTAVSGAASDASAAQTAAANAQTTASNAFNMQSYSVNASFEEWSTALPAGYAGFGTTTGVTSKDTSVKRVGNHSIRFTCDTNTVDSGMSFSNYILGHMPNTEYVTVELEFNLISGTLGGAGVLIDWTGLSNNRAIIDLAATVPSPTLGKWYRVVKTVRRPTNAAGTFAYMSGFLMANWVGVGTPRAVKTIIFDWLNIRPATTEEITAYGTPASITALSNAKPVNLFSTATPSGTAPQGSIWFQVDANGVVFGQWQQTAAGVASTWTKRDIRSEVIANLDVGKLTAGAAAMATGVIDKLWSDVVVTRMLVSTEKIITKDVIADGAVEARSIVASESMWTKVLGAHKITAAEADLGTFSADQGFIGDIWTAGLTIGVPTTNLNGSIISGQIADDAINGNHLNVEDIDPLTGQRMTLLSDGMRLWGPDNPDGDPSISLTSSEAQALSIVGPARDDAGVIQTDGSGNTVYTTVISANDRGDLIGQQVNAVRNLRYRGDEMSDILRPKVGGVVAWTDQFPATISNVSTTYGLTEISWYTPNDGVDRMYNITVSGLAFRTWSVPVVVQVRYSSGETHPNVQSTLLYQYRVPQSASGGNEVSVDFSFPKSFPAGEKVNLLITMARVSGTTNFAWINMGTAFFFAEEAGVAIAAGGLINTGGGQLPGSSTPDPTPTVPTPIEREGKWAATSFKAYGNGGASGPGSVGLVQPVQGYTPYYPSGGVAMTLLMFDYAAIQSTLSGATIKSVELWLTAEHWYAGSGGTAVITMHNYSTAPVSAGVTTPVKNEHFARGEGKWVGLSGAVGTGFQNGTTKGIGLDPADATSSEYYGYFAWTYGTPTLRIKYVK